MKNPFPPLNVLAFLIAAVTSAQSANLISNPGFESGTTGWTNWGSTITASTEQKRSGSYSCLNTGRTYFWQGCVRDLLGQMNVGTTYRITAWVRMRNVSSDISRMTMKRTDGAGDTYISSDTPLVSNDAWTPLELRYTHTVSGSLVGLNLFFEGATATSEFFVDDVTIEATYDPQAVTVDLAAGTGAVTHRATGFLFGLSDTSPTTAYFEPLKPKLVRFHGNMGGNPGWGSQGFSSPAFMSRLANAGARRQVVVSDEYMWAGYHTSWGWPGDAAHNGYGSYDLINQAVDGLLASAASNGYVNLEWDLWNEPDYAQFWGRSQAQFFATWKHIYQRIRASSPSAVIVGPSAGTFVAADNGQYIKDFLVYARDNNVLPNIVSFHILEHSKNVNAAVKTIRDFMAANGIAARPIDVNEYVGNQEFALAAKHVSYMANLERAAVHGAAHAVWDEVPGDGSSNGLWAGNLCHLLTRDTSHSPRAVWHVYRAYADFAGTMLSLKPSPFVNGLAAKDSGNTVRMIFGNDANEANQANLTITALNQLPYFNSTGSVRVVVSSIPNNGMAPLATGNVVSNTVYTPGSSSLAIPLNFAANEVLFVQVQDSGAQAVTPTSLAIVQGTLSSGNASSSATDDNSFLVVNSQTTGATRFATIDFTLTGLTPTALSNVGVRVITKSSKSSTSQQISLWNYATSTWVQVDSTTIGTSEVTRNVSVTSNASNYLSGGSMKVRITSSKTGSSSFVLSVEQVRLIVAPPIPVVVDNFSFENPLGGIGTETTNWATMTWSIFDYTAPSLEPTKGKSVAYTNVVGGSMAQVLESATLAVGEKIKVRVDVGWPSPNPWSPVTVNFNSVNGPNGTVSMPSFYATNPPANGWNTLTMDMTVSAAQAGGKLQITISGEYGIQSVVDNVRVEISR